MDGIHDLGGKRGYGAVDVNEPEEAFHSELDGIGWSINQTTRAPGLSIDWWRHIRELFPADDYLSRPYFDQWSMTQLIALIDNEQLTLDEVLSNKPVKLDNPEPTMSIENVYQSTSKAAVRFDREIDKQAKYYIGDTVTTRDFNIKGHTRLPGYAQGKQGIIQAHHGAHMFPDDCAQGSENAAHLYTVCFDSKELWPDDAVESNKIYIDLWEPYFV